MVSIRRRILHKGELIKEQFIRTLQDHEDRIAAVEEGEGSGSAYDDTEIKGDLSALAARVKVLEDAADTTEVPAPPTNEPEQ